MNYKLNKDGYFRCRIGDKNVMYHRYIYEQTYGTIPENCSVHHICENRACCNIEHLRLISKSEHASLHNKINKKGNQNNKGRKFSKRSNPLACAIIQDWQTIKNKSEIARKYNITVQRVWYWINEWEKNNDIIKQIKSRTD